LASTVIQNAPKDLDMSTALSILSDSGGLLKSARFIVRILPTGNLLQRINSNGIVSDLMYLTEIAEMPGKGFMNIDVRYYGPNHKLPFQSTYEDANFTFLCRTNSFEREFFDNWMYIINPTTHFDFSYRDEYYCDIQLFQFSDYSDDEDSPEVKYKLTLKNAYPILLNPQPMTWSDQLFQRLVVNFTYTHWVRDDFKQPTQSDTLIVGVTNER